MSSRPCSISFRPLFCGQRGGAKPGQDLLIHGLCGATPASRLHSLPQRDHGRRETHETSLAHSCVVAPHRLDTCGVEGSLNFFFQIEAHFPSTILIIPYVKFVTMPFTFLAALIALYKGVKGTLRLWLYDKSNSSPNRNSQYTRHARAQHETGQDPDLHAHKYLKTIADREQPDELLYLPSCHSLVHARSMAAGR